MLLKADAICSPSMQQLAACQPSPSNEWLPKQWCPPQSLWVAVALIWLGGSVVALPSGLYSTLYIRQVGRGKEGFVGVK